MVLSNQNERILFELHNAAKKKKKKRKDTG